VATPAGNPFGSNGYFAITVDVQLRSGSGQPLTYRFTARFLQRGILGTEGVPVGGNPAYPAPEERIRARAKSDFVRSYHPDGKVRQLAAIIGDGDRSARLKRIAAPTLVLHGADDPLVPVECGRHTAAMIPGARLHEIKGMGHDLPLELVGEVTEVIASVAR
jgi:pimeloyl-ACP methyl ester carboxylesterase